MGSENSKDENSNENHEFELKYSSELQKICVLILESKCGNAYLLSWAKKIAIYIDTYNQAKIKFVLEPDHEYYITALDVWKNLRLQIFHLMGLTLFDYIPIDSFVFEHLGKYCALQKTFFDEQTEFFRDNKSIDCIKSATEKK